MRFDVYALTASLALLVLILLHAFFDQMASEGRDLDDLSTSLAIGQHQA